MSDSTGRRSIQTDLLAKGERLYLEGKAEEAAKLCEQVLLAAPGHAGALLLSGMIAHALGRFDEALTKLKRARKKLPESPLPLKALAALYLSTGETSKAIKVLDEALELAPSDTSLLEELAKVHRQLGDLEAALKLHIQAVELEPQNHKHFYNVGVLFFEVGHLGEAIEAFAGALELEPGDAEAWRNMGVACFGMGQLEQAEQCLRHALSLDNESAPIAVNLGLVLLMRGNYGEGFALNELRFDDPSEKNGDLKKMMRQLPEARRWRGQRLEGRSLLIITEQGAGDSLMVLRFLPRLKELGLKQLTIYCEESLVGIFEELPSVDAVISKPAPVDLGEFDGYCPLMSLPHLLEVRLQTLREQTKVPYLVSPQGAGEQWRERLDALTGLKVGVVWAGGASASYDFKRSLHLTDLKPLSEVEGVSLVSLQKGAQAEAQLQGAGFELHHWMDECGDFADTLALLEGLDLVISVDTSVAHLAGAAGKPVWLLNRFESEWRWMLGREESAWYPMMRIFTQPARGDWAGVVREVAKALVVVAGQRG